MGLVNIFCFVSEETREKEYLVKNIDELDAFEWLHDNCECFGYYYYNGKMCHFEDVT